MATKLEKLNNELASLNRKGQELKADLEKHIEEDAEIKQRLGAAILDGKDSGAIEAELARHNTRLQGLVEADKQNRQRIADMAKAIEDEQRTQAITRISELSKSSDAAFDGIIKSYYQMLVAARQMMDESIEAEGLSSKTGVPIPSLVIRSRWGEWIHNEIFRWFGNLGIDVAEVLKRTGADDWRKY